MNNSYQGRAKQFLPYASLRGFEREVERIHKITEPRRELAPDAEAELSQIISRLRSQDRLRVIYYTGSSYVTVCAIFEKTDSLNRLLVFDRLSVPIDDIFSLEL